MPIYMQVNLGPHIAVGPWACRPGAWGFRGFLAIDNDADYARVAGPTAYDATIPVMRQPM